MGHHIMKKQLLPLYILICCQLFSSINAELGIKTIAPTKLIEKKQRDQLLHIMTQKPEGLALDERLFLTHSKKTAAPTKIDYINAEALDSFLKDFAHYINTTGTTYFITQADIESTFSDIAKRYYGKISSYKDYQNYKENYAQQYFAPVNFLQECQCFTARRTHNFRDIIESRIITHLIKNYPDKNSEIILTEFASGDLFQLLILATKIINAGYKSIRINCIDTAYEELLKYFKIKPGQSMTFSHEYPWTKKETNNLLYLFVKATQKKAKNIDYSKIQSLLDDYRLYNVFKQFIQWLNNITNSVQCIIYTDTQNYIKDCEQNPALKSDIILAIDYTPDENYHWWDLLRKKSLNSSGIAYSIYEIGTNYYLSEGTSSSLFHYQFIKSDTELYHYQLKKINAIPEHNDWATDQPIAAIPEIV